MPNQSTTTYTYMGSQVLVWSDCKALWVPENTEMCYPTTKQKKELKSPFSASSKKRAPLNKGYRGSKKHVSKVRLTELHDYIKTKKWDHNIAYAVMLAESGGYYKAYNSNKNGSTDKGIWQINSVHKQTNLYDWKHNTDVAYKIYKERKSITGNGWTAWSAYNNKSYTQFMHK